MLAKVRENFSLVGDVAFAAANMPLDHFQLCFTFDHRANLR